MVNVQQISPTVSIYIPHDGGIHDDSIQKMIWKRQKQKDWQQQKVVLPFYYHFYLGKVAENLHDTTYSLHWGVGVLGSNPAAPTIFSNINHTFR